MQKIQQYQYKKNLENESPSTRRFSSGEIAANTDGLFVF